MSSNYDTDYYSWTRDQRKFLREGMFSMLDTENLLEELLSLGNSEESKLENHLSNILMHMLKIKYQPGKHTRSWDLSIKNAKYQASRTLGKSPGLKHRLKDTLESAYYSARINAAKETDIAEDVFPETCPWDVEKILEIKK